MSQKRIYLRRLAPLYRRIPFARLLLWQARFLTPEGARLMTYRLLDEFADEVTFQRDGAHWTIPTRDNSLSLGVFINNAFAAIYQGCGKPLSILSDGTPIPAYDRRLTNLGKPASDTAFA